MTLNIRFLIMLWWTLIVTALSRQLPLASKSQAMKVLGGTRKAPPSTQPPPPPPTLRDRIRPAAENAIERTFYSSETIPKSASDAEWMGFINGWLLVTLPIPLPLLIASLVANTAILFLSKWDEEVKNKYLIGFYHGVMVLAVTLRELELSGEGYPRIVLMGLNLGANLFLGQAGSYVLTKRVMDSATYGTLFYILINYFH